MQLALEAATFLSADSVKIEDVWDLKEMPANEKQKFKHYKSGALYILRRRVRKIKIKATARLSLIWVGGSMRGRSSHWSYRGASQGSDPCCQS